MARRRSSTNGAEAVAVLLILGGAFIGAWLLLKALYRATELLTLKVRAMSIGRSRPPPRQPLPDPRAQLLEEALEKLTEAESQRDRWREVAKSSEDRHTQTRVAVDELRARSAALERERDRWRAKAESFANVEAGSTSGPNDRKMFTRLRSVVVKCVHPDHCDGPAAERRMREELFKRIWPEIERIAGER